MDTLKSIVDAIKLPTKLKISIAMASGALWLLLSLHLISVPKWDDILIPLLLIAAIVFGIFVIVDLFEWLLRPLTIKKQSSILAARRLKIRDERAAAREQGKTAVLRRIDHLSKEELGLVIKALDGMSPSIQTWVRSSAAASLCHKCLLESPGGMHHEDYFPFVFPDFVWEVLLAREEELRGRWMQLSKAK